MKDKLIFGFEIGELCSEEIQIKPLIDVKKLTEGDDNPFFVTVRALKIGVSGNKKNYSLKNLQQLKEQLPLYGYLGHLKKEDVSYRYREPVTVWIGGEINDDWLYIKGYVPPQYETHRKDVALSLNIGKPMPVSVLGFYLLKPHGEYYDVLDIYGISIDWANDRMEGVKGAHVIEIGKEQTERQIKEEDMPTREEILAALTAEDIKKERPDLVKSIESEMQGSEQVKKEKKDQEEKIKTLEKENTDLKKQTIDSHRTKLLGEIENEKMREIASDLLQGETIKKLDENWKLVKGKLGKLERPGMPIISGANEKKPGAEFIEDRLLTSKEA